MIETLAVALVPIFFGLLLGYFAGVFKIADNINVRTLMTFVMNFALPCALFSSIVKVPRTVLLGQGNTIWILAVVYLLIFFATYFYGRSVAKESPKDASVLAMTVSFPNITAVGIPLLDATYGTYTGMLVAIGLAVGTLTISPLGLVILEGNRTDHHARSPLAHFASAIVRTMRRPVVWAPVLGIVFSLCNLSLPAFAMRSLGVMGTATAGAALFLTGLIVSARSLSFDATVILGALAKNVIQPAICLGIGLLLHLPHPLLAALVLTVAIPSGFFGIVFGKSFDASPQSASSGLVYSYILSILSLAGWVVVLGHLG
jgi:malonate transporter and related proteins